MRSRWWLLALVYLLLPLAPVLLVRNLVLRRRARRLFSQYRRVVRVEGETLEFEDGSSRTLTGPLRGRVIHWGGERIDAPSEVGFALDDGSLFARADEEKGVLTPVLTRLETHGEPAREVHPDATDGLLIPAALMGALFDVALVFLLIRSR